MRVWFGRKVGEVRNSIKRGKEGIFGSDSSGGKAHRNEITYKWITSITFLFPNFTFTL